MTKQLESLREDLAALKEDAADRFDPVKFRYIEAVVGRAGAKSEAVAVILASKAHRALSQYRERYEQAHQQSITTLQKIADDFPDFSSTAEELRRQGRFARLEKMFSRLMLSGQQQHTDATSDVASDIKALTAILNQQTVNHSDDSDSTPLEERMRSQEADLVSALGQQEPAGNRTAVAELKSARRFRTIQAKQNADKLVTQAMAEIPESSGPLNSQRLAARSLAAMRDLSPYYLSRFVTYMDTLFWLDQADKKKGG